MSKRGENIRKRKDGRWEARIKIKVNGENKYHSIKIEATMKAKWMNLDSDVATKTLGEILFGK